MPYASRRKADALNRAYAFLSEPSFGEAARALVDKLVAMGFDEEEARDSIERAQTEFETDSDLFLRRGRTQADPSSTPSRALPELISELNKREGVTVLETEGGKGRDRRHRACRRGT